MAHKGPEAWFDRTVSRPLLAALSDGNEFAMLRDFRSSDPRRHDLQLRADQKNGTSWATVYVGLAAILNLEERHGDFRITAAETYRKVDGFRSGWGRWQQLHDLQVDRDAITSYLLRAAASVADQYTNREGLVHGALCSGLATGYHVINREAQPAFADRPTLRRWQGDIGEPLYKAVDIGSNGERWWPGVQQHEAFGTRLDVLAVDPAGQRLLVIEAKPPDTLEGLTWGPAQVRFYAEMYARILDSNAETVGHLQTMLGQRTTLGLTRPLGTALNTDLSVVPVLAIGEGSMSPAADNRIAAVADVMAGVAPGSSRIEPMMIWRIDADGRASMALHGEATDVS